MTESIELPPRWEWSTLEQIAAIIMGQSPPSSTYNTKGAGLPFFQGKAEFGQDYPSPRYWCSESVKIAETGDVLISVRAPVGPTNLAPDRCCIGRGLAAIRSEKNISNFYVRRYLQYIQNEIAELGTGTTFAAIGRDILKALGIPLAPAAEQRRIVEKIDELFSLIEAGEQALARARKLLERYRQSVLNAAVTGELTKDWRERHQGEIESGDALLKRILKARREAWEKAELAKLHARGRPPTDSRWKQKYKDPQPPDTSTLPTLPEGWAWATLEMLTDIVGGITVDAKRTGPDLREVPYLRVANVQRGRLELSEIKTLLAPPSKIDELRLAHGDILLNEGGDRDKIGRGWVWEGQIECCIHQNHVFRARPYIFDIPSRYISYYANEMGRDYFFSQGKQTTNLASINLTKVSHLPIPIPSAAEAVQIVELIDEACSVVDHVISDSDLQRSEAGRLRQAILAAAFSGRLVPQDPTDEPASVLLARIREERAHSAAKPTKRPRSGRCRGTSSQLSLGIEEPGR